MLIIIKVLVIAFVSSYLISACDDTALTDEQQRIVKETDLLLQKYIDLDIFSGVVLLAEDGQSYYHKAFGLASREHKIPNELNTKFDIGSMNKTFTKIVIMQLVDESKINLEDNLGKYLTGFPEEAANNITITHLLGAILA
jgi:CubicO group peptidase (beta-lactamase class C family)